MLVKVKGEDYIIKFFYSNYSTYCKIRRNGENNYYYGEATCSSKDNFNKRIGRKIALSRAMSHMGLNKETRTQVWQEFFKQCKR